MAILETGFVARFSGRCAERVSSAGEHAAVLVDETAVRVTRVVDRTAERLGGYLPELAERAGDFVVRTAERVGREDRR